MYNRTLASAYTVVSPMALSATHRRWLLSAPSVLVAGFIVLTGLAILLGPRRAAAYGFALFGAAFVVSLISTAVALIEHWPPFRGWAAKDKVCLIAGSSPLLLGIAVMAITVYYGERG